MDFHEEDNNIIRSSRLQMFLKIGVLEKLQYSQENTRVRVSFIIELLGFRPATLFRRDS